MRKITFDDLARLRLLLSVEGIGPGKIFNLLNKFHTFEEIFTSSRKDLQGADLINSQLSERLYSNFCNIDREVKSLESELHKLDNMGGQIISYWDETYPELLKNIYYPPLLLYILGNLKPADKNSIAVVGTRTPSQYGKIEAEKFAENLSLFGLTVVSGLARGIDSIAHKSALKSGGRTIAVTGSGLDVVYPPENKNLFKEISESGCIISEFPLGTKPDAPNFPKRNRIIAGISLGTLVIETRASGGAVQTAAHALTQNREVFALPGNIGVAQSEGTNLLIQRSEAKLTTNINDIINELRIDLFRKERDKKNVFIELSLFEEKILENLSEEPMQVDLLSKRVDLSTSECLVYLLQLEFKGLVKQLPGKMFLSTA